MLEIVVLKLIAMMCASKTRRRQQLCPCTKSSKNPTALHVQKTQLTTRVSDSNHVCVLTGVSYEWPVDNYFKYKTTARAPLRFFNFV